MIKSFTCTLTEILVNTRAMNSPHRTAFIVYYRKEETTKIKRIRDEWETLQETTNNPEHYKGSL